MNFTTKEKAAVAANEVASNILMTDIADDTPSFAILVFGGERGNHAKLVNEQSVFSIMGELSKQIATSNFRTIGVPELSPHPELNTHIEGSANDRLLSFANYLKTKKANKTSQSYFYDARNILTLVSREHFGDTKLDELDLSDITVEQVSAAEQKLFKEGRLKPSTLNRLKQGWNCFCVFVGMDAWRFSRTINMAREYKSDVISNEDVIKIIDNCQTQRRSAKTDKERIRLYRREISIRLGWEIGLRSCEYGNAKFNEIEKDGRITIKNSKHNGTRILAVTNEIKTIILDFKNFLQERDMYPSGDGVFEKPDKKNYSTSTFRRWLKKAASDCGILYRQAKTHDLRHRFARNFHSCTQDDFMLADIMGHKSTATTRAYAAKTFEELKDAIQVANDKAKQVKNA